MSHFLLMVAYAALVSTFFSLLWRSEPRARVKLFLQMFLAMVLGAIVLGWLMFPFPSGPPGPVP